MGSKLTLGRARVWRLRNSVLAVAFVGIATLRVFASDAEGSKPGEGVPKPDYSQEPFVIEHAQRRIRFEKDGTGQREAIVRVRVQNEAGVRQWGQLVFGYNSANERIDIPYVRVVKADNSVITAAADAIQDLTSPIVRFAPVYTDYHEKHVTVPSLRPGDVLEYDVIAVVQTPLAPDQFWFQHDFQKTAIVLDEQLEIDVPSSRAIKLKNKPGLDPTITEGNGRRVYRWTSSHLVREDQNKDTEPKKKKKNPEDEFPDVQLTTFTSWDEVGHWYQDLEKDRRVPSAAIRAKAEELTKGLHTDIEKVEALYDYTAKNFRYVSLSLGLGRYQPHAADDVFRNQYGDCKDKNTLLESLLEAVGIHAAPALINSYRKIDPDVPSPSQFNHVITTVSVGNEQLWMDTTTEVAPFRYLMYALRKKQALLIPADGIPRLAETPADPAVPEAENVKFEGKVDDSGNLDANITYQLRGDTEIIARQVFRSTSNTQWQQIMEGESSSLGLGKDVTEIKFSDTQATREPFKYSYHASKPGYLDWLKAKIDLKLPLPAIGLPVVDPATQDDPEAVKFVAPSLYDLSLRLEFPAKYTVRTPVPVSVKRDYGEYEATYRLDGSVFTAERKLTLSQRELSSARAQDYIAFRQTVLNDLGQQLSLETTVSSAPSVPSNMKAEDLVKSGDTERRNGNYALAIDLLNRAVAADPKSPGVWNDLGLAYYDSRQDELAIAAFQKQIEINPYDQLSYNNLGRVYLKQRKYDEAVKWFRKQIEVVPLDKYAHRNLGITYVDMHQDDEAVPELLQAASLTPNDADVEVTLGQAYLNLGQDEKAMAAFEKAVGISPTPRIWNNVAFQLARKNTHLDLARNYAESSISTTVAALRTLSLDQLTLQNVGWTSTLANSWDTLGWIDFAAGDLKRARNYVSAAWYLSQDAVIADHAARICEQTGDKKAAIHFYGLALNARSPEVDTKSRLAALVGGENKVDQITAKYHDELVQERTVTLRNPSKQRGTADFFILVTGSLKAGASCEGVKFVSGDDKLKTFQEAICASKISQPVPDENPVKILRRGTLSCQSLTEDCSFVLALPDDVRSVN
jgi:tetratricopeptide (TPR) repeat protein